MKREKNRKKGKKNNKFRPDSNSGSPVQWAISLPLHHGDILQTVRYYFI